MKHLIFSTLICTLSFITISQKKRDTLPPTKHNHSMYWDYSYNFASNVYVNNTLGYEYWFRKNLIGVAANVGLGYLPYQKVAKKKGALFLYRIGSYFTVGKNIGLKLGTAVTGRINPLAYTGFYNQDGNEVSYPITDEGYNQLPGSMVEKWNVELAFEIGPYFTLSKGMVNLYLHFTSAFIWEEYYYDVPKIRHEYWAPYCGFSIAWNFSEIYKRAKEKRSQK